jgi:fatty acid desaturase
VPAAGVSLQKVMARYAVPRYGPAVSNLLSSVTLYVGLIGAACVALRFSAWLAGGLSVVAAGFLLRTFIVFHDCAHGSFVPSKRANALLGAALGVLVYTPFALWRRQHAIHHATAGDLDRRGVGDVHTLTVEEYLALPWWGRLRYRLFRNPVVMFGLGPFWVLLLGPRLVSWSYPRRLQRSVLGTDLVLVVVIATLCWLLGWQGFLIVQLPALLVSGSIGIWLFYVQHQFEDTYWQSNETWSYDDAAQAVGRTATEARRLSRCPRHAHAMTAAATLIDRCRAHSETRTELFSSDHPRPRPGLETHHSFRLTPVAVGFRAKRADRPRRDGQRAGSSEGEVRVGSRRNAACQHGRDPPRRDPPTGCEPSFAGVFSRMGDEAGRQLEVRAGSPRLNDRRVSRWASRATARRSS